jgi:hypothetical protein
VLSISARPPDGELAAYKVKGSEVERPGTVCLGEWEDEGRGRDVHARFLAGTLHGVLRDPLVLSGNLKVVRCFSEDGPLSLPSIAGLAGWLSAAGRRRRRALPAACQTARDEGALVDCGLICHHRGGAPCIIARFRGQQQTNYCPTTSSHSCHAFLPSCLPTTPLLPTSLRSL